MAQRGNRMSATPARSRKRIFLPTFTTRSNRLDEKRRYPNLITIVERQTGLKIVTPPGNGYTAGGTQPSVSSSAQTSGTYKLVLADVVFTASGGTIGPFRYAVLYNDTPTSPADPLVLYWDYGASLTLQDGETFTVDFDAANGVMTLA